MSGAFIKMTVDETQVRHLFKQLEWRCENMQPAFNVAGQVIENSVRLNFRSGGRPDKWAKSSYKGKRGNKPLINRGMAGGLMGSISHRATSEEVSVGSDKIYAAIHNNGGETGRNHATTIVKREFLLIQDEDWGGIKDAAMRWLV